MSHFFHVSLFTGHTTGKGWIDSYRHNKDNPLKSLSYYNMIFMSAYFLRYSWSGNVGRNDISPCRTTVRFRHGPSGIITKSEYTHDSPPLYPRTGKLLRRTVNVNPKKDPPALQAKTSPHRPGAVERRQIELDRLHHHVSSQSEGGALPDTALHERGITRFSNSERSFFRYGLMILSVNPCPVGFEITGSSE